MLEPRMENALVSVEGFRDGPQSRGRPRSVSVRMRVPVNISLDVDRFQRNFPLIVIELDGSHTR